MQKEKTGGFGKGVVVGGILAVVLIGSFWFFSNRNKDNVDVNKKVEELTEEKKNNEDKEIEKKDQGGGEVKRIEKEELKGRVFEDTFNGQDFSFVVLDGWKINDKVQNKIGLLKKGQKADKKNVGDIVLTFKSNKENFDFDRFYDGLNDVNYFADASNGFEKKKVNGLDVYEFKDVVGLAESTIVVVKTDRGYVEIADVRNVYQDNGVFDDVAGSFEVK